MKNEDKKASRRRKRGKGSSIVTRESVSAVFVVFSLLAFIILCTKEALFDAVGGAIHGFLTGVFGVFAYPVMLGILYLSFMGLIGKRLVRNRKAGACIAFTVLFIALIVQTAMTYKWNLNTYLERCYQAPTLKDKPFMTVCGWLGGVPIWGLAKLTTRVGTLVIFSVLTLLFGFLSVLSIRGRKAHSEPKLVKEKKPGKQPAERPVEIPLMQPQQSPVQAQQPQKAQYARQQPVDTAQRPGVVLNGQKSNAGRGYSPFAPGQTQPMQTPADRDAKRKFLFGKSAKDQYKDNLIFDPNSRANNRPQQGQTPQANVPYTQAYQNAVNNQPSRPEKIVRDYSNPYTPADRTPAQTSPNAPRGVEVPPVMPVQPVYDRETPVIPQETERGYRDEAPRSTSEDVRGYDDRGRSGLDIFDEENDPYSLRDDFSEDARGRDSFMRESREDTLLSGRGNDGYFADERGYAPRAQQPVAPPEPPKPRVIRPYVQPRLDDFTCTDVQPMHNIEEEETIKNNIINTLEDYKVTDATIVSTTHGPTVTRYNVAITRDTLPQKVLALESPLAMSLQSSLISVTPNYDSGTISVEVPNKNRQFVNLGSMLSGDTFVNAKPSSLMFTMGKDVSNAKVYGDLSKMVHLLVAGGTGGGKSVFLGAMIMSLIYKYSPEELRLILIDPKKTEFSLYYNLPHLMINEIITDSKKTVRALNWAEGEMNRRYELISQMTKSGKFVQNIDQYNGYVEKEHKLPKIVIIIDELADLMLTSDRKDIEERIQSLTQKARAAGIHVVVATQRPSTNVITGVIKTNLTTRIAFSVPTDVDSRVILDHTGAQNLCGLGDMLYFISGMKSPVRVQSPFISPEEAQRIVNFIKDNNESYYDEEATAYINDTRGGMDNGADDGDEFDPVYIQALRYVILSNTASISLVQRKCSIGYNKAGKIIDWMDNKGYITPFDGAKARKVLITKEDFEALYGPF